MKKMQNAKCKMQNFLVCCLLSSVYCLLSTLFMGCEQESDDPDNAIVSGYIYKRAIPTDSVFVDSVWQYIDWDFYDPVESVHVFVESDIYSDVPYAGPDIDGYTDSTGLFWIPIYLGHTAVKDCDGNITGYQYVEYCDVRTIAFFEGGAYDYGGGITLGRGREFRLWPIALNWMRP